MCWQSPCAHLNVIISNLGGCPKDYNGDNTTHQRLEVPLTIFKNGTIEKSTQSNHQGFGKDVGGYNCTMK